MRIVGHIDHTTYKMTILEMNHRLSLQIEDGDLVQTFRFRDGLVEQATDIHSLVDEIFLTRVETTFLQMNVTKKEALANLVESQDDFPEII